VFVQSIQFSHSVSHQHRNENSCSAFCFLKIETSLILPAAVERCSANVALLDKKKDLDDDNDDDDVDKL
jgi:hypothetical protein